MLAELIEKAPAVAIKASYTGGGILAYVGISDLGLEAWSLVVGICVAVLTGLTSMALNIARYLRETRRQKREDRTERGNSDD